MNFLRIFFFSDRSGASQSCLDERDCRKSNKTEKPADDHAKIRVSVSNVSDLQDDPTHPPLQLVKDSKLCNFDKAAATLQESYSKSSQSRGSKRICLASRDVARTCSQDLSPHQSTSSRHNCRCTAADVTRAALHDRPAPSDDVSGTREELLTSSGRDETSARCKTDWHLLLTTCFSCSSDTSSSETFDPSDTCLDHLHLPGTDSDEENLASAWLTQAKKPGFGFGLCSSDASSCQSFEETRSEPTQTLSRDTVASTTRAHRSSDALCSPVADKKSGKLSQLSGASKCVSITFKSKKSLSDAPTPQRLPVTSSGNTAHAFWVDCAGTCARASRIGSASTSKAIGRIS